MNHLGGVFWELSFSYGRALQEKTLLIWQGKEGNRGLAQKTLLHRAKCNGAARFGTYSEEMEGDYFAILAIYSSASATSSLQPIKIGDRSSLS